MTDERCIYCGSGDISPTNEYKLLKEKCRTFKCNSCNSRFSSLDRKTEADDMGADDTPICFEPDFSISGEAPRKDVPTLKQFQYPTFYTSRRIFSSPSLPTH